MTILGIAIMAGGILLYLLGVYTGIWLARHSREVVEREVPKIVTTEKVVEIEKPVLVQLPAQPLRQHANNGGSLPIMGQPSRSVIADPVMREQAERIQQLAAHEPEAG